MLNDGLSYIGDRCFQESNLKHIEFPPTLKVIGANAFYQCRNLRSAELPNCLEEIGLFAFFECALENVEFPASLRRVA